MVTTIPNKHVVIKLSKNKAMEIAFMTDFRKQDEAIYLQNDDNADDTMVNDDTVDGGLQGFLMNGSDDGIRSNVEQIQG